MTDTYHPKHQVLCVGRVKKVNQIGFYLDLHRLGDRAGCVAFVRRQRHQRARHVVHVHAIVATAEHARLLDLTGG